MWRYTGWWPHLVIVDEVHEHPNSLVIDKLRAGFKGRRQPLLIEITNSGFDRQSICFQHHEYSEKVLERHIARQGTAPRQTASDGGYASLDNLKQAKALGVEDVAFHKKRALTIDAMVKSRWVYRNRNSKNVARQRLGSPGRVFEFRLI